MAKKSSNAAPGSSPESYNVGYRRPPSQYQFKPGRSGNPTGINQKRARSMASDLKVSLEHELKKSVKIQKGKQTLTVTQAAAGNLKKVTLELGGKSPQVLYKDADMDVAIPGAANGIFFNQGQCCNAGSRLYIERDVYDEVVHGISDAAKKIKLGPGLDPATQMGPLISAEQHEKVLGYVSSGLQDGASAPAGGGRAGDHGYFVQPTVLTDTTPDMKVVREEIFGPVVCAIPFSSEDDDVIRTGNDTNYGLASGIWTRDINKAYRTAHRLRAGTVWINCYSVFDAAMPFGGYKESGWGREMGHNALENYLETKSVVTQLG